MSKLDVKILHQDYVLTCPPGQETQLLEAVERVDQQLQTMRGGTSKLRSREHVAVLLAVNLAFENLNLREQLLTLQKQVTAQRNDEGNEYLLSLEALIAQEQTLAEQLLQRLDHALGTEKSIESASETDTHRDNNNGVGLPTSSIETL